MFMQPRISAVMAVARSNAHLRGRVRQLREIESLRRGLDRRLRRLTQALELSGSSEGEELVAVPGGLQSPAPQTAPAAERRRRARVWRRAWDMSKGIPDGARDAVRDRMRAEGMYRRAEVEAVRDQLQARIQALSVAHSRLLSDLRDVVAAPAAASAAGLPRSA
jgi:hypothetical protein